MTGVDERGEYASVILPTRMDGYSPGVDELFDLGPEAERNAAIIALNRKCQWSSPRLSRLFDISERRVFQILADWDRFVKEMAR